MSNTSVNGIKDMIGTVPLYFPYIQVRNLPVVLITFSYHINTDANDLIILGTCTTSIFVHKMWVNLIITFPPQK